MLNAIFNFANRHVSRHFNCPDNNETIAGCIKLRSFLGRKLKSIPHLFCSFYGITIGLLQPPCKVNIYATIFFPIIMFAFASCRKDWLDKKANKTQSVPSTLKDYQLLMDNYRILNFDYLVLREIASDDHHTSENAWLSSSDIARNAYSWTHNVPYLSVGDWNSTYFQIYHTNSVLDGLKKIESSESPDMQKLNDIKGQALLFRANFIFQLTQQYSAPYNTITSANDLGVPLKLEADINIPTVRSSLLQSYEQIINDLMHAKNLLPTTPLYRTRPSKPAVFATLARVYLSMRNYEKAGEFADSCLKLHNTLIDYNELLTNGSFNGSFIGHFANNPEVIFHFVSYQFGHSGFLTNNCFIDTSFYQSYENDDLRKLIYFRQNADGSLSFRGTYNNSAQSLFWGPATDEMYLIRAECSARRGDRTVAMSDLNTLLEKRWKAGTFIPFTAVSADDALFQILKERRKELVLRGLRWSDLRRLNQEDRFKITLARTIGGDSYILVPNSHRYTFPIPDDIIAASEIPQNPGW